MAAYFDFLCDYYTYDGEYDDQYLWGGMTVDGPVIVSYDDVGDDDCLVYYESAKLRKSWLTILFSEYIVFL